MHPYKMASTKTDDTTRYIQSKKHMLHVNELSKETLNIEYICKHVIVQIKTVSFQMPKVGVQCLFRAYLCCFVFRLFVLRGKYGITFNVHVCCMYRWHTISICNEIKTVIEHYILFSSSENRPSHHKVQRKRDSFVVYTIS